MTPGSDGSAKPFGPSTRGRRARQAGQRSAQSRSRHLQSNHLLQHRGDLPVRHPAYLVQVGHKGDDAWPQLHCTHRHRIRCLARVAPLNSATALCAFADLVSNLVDQGRIRGISIWYCVALSLTRHAHGKRDTTGDIAPTPTHRPSSERRGRPGDRTDHPVCVRAASDPPLVRPWRTAPLGACPRGADHRPQPQARRRAESAPRSAGPARRAAHEAQLRLQAARRNSACAHLISPRPSRAGHGKQIPSVLHRPLAPCDACHAPR